MSIDRKELSKALHILNDSPNKIADAEAKCRATLAEIKKREATGDWAVNTLKAERERAFAERNRVCHALAHSMRAALETVKANNNLAEQTLDINSPKIQNAVNVLSLMGKNLTYADAASMLEGFRGDPAALRFIKSAFEKQGLNYAAKQAASMMRSVSSQAIQDMETVLDFSDYAEAKGEWNFPIERAMWSKGEFADMIGRMGYDGDNAPDPYAFALDVAMQDIREEEMSPTISEDEDPVAAATERARIQAQKYKIANAQREVANARANGKDPAEVFNKAMSAIENATAKTQAEANA